MRIRFFFRWYDFWVGFYIDRQRQTLYFCPIPMCGIRVELTKIEFERHTRASCGGFFAWLFTWSWGVTKFGDREWGLRICGRVVQNTIEV